MPQISTFFSSGSYSSSLAGWFTVQRSQVLAEASFFFLVTAGCAFVARRVVIRIAGQRLLPHTVNLIATVVTFGLWLAGLFVVLERLGLSVHGLIASIITPSLVRACLVLLAASVIAPLARRSVIRLVEGRWSRQQVELTRRTITSLIWGISFTTALSELGFDLRVVLGAAGAVSVALTFASQNSIAQLITGLFIVAEQPFDLGDTITLAGVTGEVLSIDVLSIKLRTPDNLFVRIPNDMLFKSAVVNNSHFPIRRFDVDISIDYSCDISHVSKTLFAVASRNPLSLEDPKPIFIFGGFADNAMTLQFCVWGRRENFLDMKNSIFEDIKRAFDKEGIPMPFPQRVLSFSDTKPLRLEQAASREDNKSA